MITEIVPLQVLFIQKALLTVGDHGDIVHWLDWHLFGQRFVVQIIATICQLRVNTAAFHQTFQGMDQVRQPNANSKRVRQDLGKGITKMILELVDIEKAVTWFVYQGRFVHEVDNGFVFHG